MRRFSPDERAALLAARFVGPKVIERLEEAGFSDLASLAVADAEAICRGVSASLGSTCWANSPQARAAVANAVAIAVAVARAAPPEGQAPRGS